MYEYYRKSSLRKSCYYIEIFDMKHRNIFMYTKIKSINMMIMIWIGRRSTSIANRTAKLAMWISCAHEAKAHIIYDAWITHFFSLSKSANSYNAQIIQLKCIQRCTQIKKKHTQNTNSMVWFHSINLHCVMEIGRKQNWLNLTCNFFTHKINCHEWIKCINSCLSYTISWSVVNNSNSATVAADKKKTKYKSKRIIITQPIHKLIGINLLFIQIVVIIHVSLFVILTNMMR